jgi:cytochrome oxidase Cu insertion factor (SCO1/SenC/PrrC family)
MTLKEQIDEYKQKSAGKAPPEAVAIMQRSTAELQNSIASRNIPAVGESLPSFSLPDSQGNSVSSADLLAKGPLIVTFFRGMW